MHYNIKADQMIWALENRKCPVCVKHGVIAVWEGTVRIIKENSKGQQIRTSKRLRIPHAIVPKTKAGFVEAFNIIIGSWANYGYVKWDSKMGVLMTSNGRDLNRTHLREVDHRVRMGIFEMVYRRLFAKDIEEWKMQNNSQGETE